MINIPEHLIQKIQNLGSEVERTLRRKGLVIPVQNDDGSVSVGNYKIVKTAGLYNILDYAGEPVVTKINLAKCAAVVANDLALGRFVNKSIVENDRNYGFALFEEQLTEKSLLKRQRDIERKELLLTKHSTAQAKKNFYKSEVSKCYEKLRNIL